MLGSAKPERGNQAEPRPALWRRFRARIFAVGLSGLLISLFADSHFDFGDSYWNAVREVGGAVVAGAILAGLVVWFEDKREDERFNREEAREAERIRREEVRLDQAARKALLRETFMRLSTVVHSDLAESRRVWLLYLEKETRTRPLLVEPAVGSGPTRTFQTAIGELETCISLIDNEMLDDAYSIWDSASNRHRQGQAPAPPTPVKRPPGPAGQFYAEPARFEKPPTRDLKAHKQTAAAEQEAWDGFISALHAYAADQFAT